MRLIGIYGGLCSGMQQQVHSKSELKTRLKSIIYKNKIRTVILMLINNNKFDAGLIFGAT